MPQCASRIAELFLQRADVEVRVGEARVERQTLLVAGDRFFEPVLTLERDRTVEAHQRRLLALHDGQLVELHRVVEALRLAQDRPEVQVGVGEVRGQRERLPVRRFGGRQVA